MDHQYIRFAQTFYYNQSNATLLFRAVVRWPAVAFNPLSVMVGGSHRTHLGPRYVPSINGHDQAEFLTLAHCMYEI